MVVNRTQIFTGSGINVIAGIWLIIAPFLLGYIGTSRTNDIILGIVIGVLALIRIFAPDETEWLSWVNVILGIWLIAAPFILSYASTAALWNDIIVGVIVVILGATSAMAR